MSNLPQPQLKTSVFPREYSYHKWENTISLPIFMTTFPCLPCTEQKRERTGTDVTHHLLCWGSRHYVLDGNTPGKALNLVCQRHARLFGQPWLHLHFLLAFGQGHVTNPGRCAASSNDPSLFWAWTLKTCWVTLSSHHWQPRSHVVRWQQDKMEDAWITGSTNAWSVWAFVWTLELLDC